MAYADPEVKRAKAKERYRLKRQQDFLNAGIDPSLIPIRDDGKRGPSIKPRKDTSLPQDLILEILPLPGETAEQNKRRKARLKANFYNSKLTPERRAEKNAKVREAYKSDAIKLRDRRKQIYNADPERHREYGRKYFLKNRDARLQKLQEWATKNPDKVRAARERWAETNKTLLSQYSSAYRVKLADAAPVWTDWDAIYWLYEEAAKRTSITGVKHAVDHILPINGDNVSGLHVWWNLKVITETENCRKGNRWSEEDGLAPMQED